MGRESRVKKDRKVKDSTKVVHTDAKGMVEAEILDKFNNFFRKED